MFFYCCGWFLVCFFWGGGLEFAEAQSRWAASEKQTKEYMRSKTIETNVFWPMVIHFFKNIYYITSSHNMT